MLPDVTGTLIETCTHVCFPRVVKSSLVTGSTENRKRVFIQCVSKGVLKLKHSVVRQWLILTIIITFFKYTIFSMQWIWSEWPMPTFSQIKIRNHVHWKSVFWTMLLNYLLQNNPSVKSSPSMIACRWKLRCENWEIWCFSNRRNGFHIQCYENVLWPNQDSKPNKLKNHFLAR